MYLQMLETPTRRMVSDQLSDVMYGRFVLVVGESRIVRARGSSRGEYVTDLALAREASTFKYPVLVLVLTPYNRMPNPLGPE